MSAFSRSIEIGLPVTVGFAVGIGGAAFSDGMAIMSAAEACHSGNEVTNPVSRVMTK